MLGPSGNLWQTSLVTTPCQYLLSMATSRLLVPCPTGLPAGDLLKRTCPAGSAFTSVPAHATLVPAPAAWNRLSFSKAHGPHKKQAQNRSPATAPTLQPTSTLPQLANNFQQLPMQKTLGSNQPEHNQSIYTSSSIIHQHLTTSSTTRYYTIKQTL